MAVFFPDTSTLISLFDEKDPLHNKAREVIRECGIKEIFVPMSVQTEWQSRTMREHNRLVLATIRLLDKKRNEKVSELTIRDLNIIIDAASREVKNYQGINSRKLDHVKSDLQKVIAEAFRTEFATPLTKLGVLEIKGYMIRLKYAFYEKGTSIIGFFIQHGYSHPDISEEVEKSVKKYISEHVIELETQDAMILGDLMRYAAADTEIYNFVVGDKDFFKKGSKYVDSFDIVKSKLNFIFLSGDV